MAENKQLEDIRARLRYLPKNAFNIRHNGRDNVNIVVRDTGKYGLGLFATNHIREGEIVIWFDGPLYQAEKASDLPYAEAYNVRDRAIQNGQYSWLYASGLGLYVNHSCNANCGVAQNFERYSGDTLVAIRTIRPGEQVMLDYAMTEDSNWRMECRCGSAKCRGIVGAYSLLDENQRTGLDRYISPYIAEKYNRPRRRK